MWRRIIPVMLSLSGLSACNEYLAYVIEPDLADRPSDQGRYQTDLGQCQSEVAAKPDTNDMLVPFSLSGYGPIGAAQDNGTIQAAEEALNHCMDAKGYRIKPWPSAG